MYLELNSHCFSNHLDIKRFSTSRFSSDGITQDTIIILFLKIGWRVLKNNNKMSERPCSIDFPSLENKISIFEQGSTIANKVQKHQKQKNNEDKETFKGHEDISRLTPFSTTTKIDER